MKLTTIALVSAFATVITPISFTTIAQANSFTRPACKLSDNCVYGPQVSDRWIEGSRFEQEGDFDSARVAYIRAFNAAEKLSLPGIRTAPMKRLRACATMGSFARLQGAIDGSNYMKSHQLTAENTKAAIEISRQKFQDVIAEQTSKFPELKTGCP